MMRSERHEDKGSGRIPTERAMHLLLFACFFDGLQRFATVADTPSVSSDVFTAGVVSSFRHLHFGFLVLRLTAWHVPVYSAS